MSKRTTTHSSYALRLFGSVGLLLFGLGLRLWLHGVHGIDGDDGFTVALLQNEPMALLTGLLSMELDVHPPLYYMALKGWALAIGDSLVALRSFNFLVDVLLGAMLLRSTRHFGRYGWCWMSMLWATAPLLLYTDQLLRMYTLLALWSALGTLSLLEMSAGRPRWILGLIVAVVGALYTHIFGMLLLMSWGIALAVAWLSQMLRLKVVMAALMGMALISASYLPLLQQRLALLGPDEVAGQTTRLLATPLQIPAQILSAALLNERQLSVPVGIAALILVCGLGFAIWRSHWSKRWLVLSLVMPLYAALIAAALLDFFRPRYLTLLVPPLLLLIVASLDALLHMPKQTSKLGMAFVCGLLLIGSGRGLWTNVQPSLSDDFRAAAQFLDVRATADDLILVIPDWGRHALDYHHAGPAPIWGALSGVGNDTDLSAVLAEPIAAHERIWFVSYQPDVSDAQRLAQHWLTQRAVTITQVFPSGMSVTGYDTQVILDQLPADATPLDAIFDERLDLHGVRLPVTKTAATDTRLHPPSAWIPVVLYLAAVEPFVPEQVRVRLTDDSGQTWGLALERGNDTLRRFDPAKWQMGQLYEVYLDVNLNPAMPAGTYWLEIMMFDGEVALPVSGADGDEELRRVLIGEVTIR